MSNSKQYKLEKRYPSLPDWIQEGYIAHGSTDPNADEYGIAQFKTKPYRSHVLPAHEVENNPEFWKKLGSEAPYKIVSFRFKKTGAIKASWGFDEGFEGDAYWEIYGVRRKSDDEIFEIGDCVRGPSDRTSRIEKLDITRRDSKDRREVYAVTGCASSGIWLSSLEHVGRNEGKEYRILSFTNRDMEGSILDYPIYALDDDGKYKYLKSHKDNPPRYSIHKMRDSPVCIYSVERLSDGEVFGIGDKVLSEDSGPAEITAIFEVNKPKIYPSGIQINAVEGCTDLNKLSHYKPIGIDDPIFSKRQIVEASLTAMRVSSQPLNASKSRIEIEKLFNELNINLNEVI